MSGMVVQSTAPVGRTCNSPAGAQSGLPGCAGSAQITENHPLETLVGQQVAAVVNFPPRQIGPVVSEVLTLGFPDAEGKVVLVQPSKPVPNGGRLF